MHLIKLFVNLRNRNIKLCRGLLYHLTGQSNQLHVKIIITKSREVGTYLCLSLKHKEGEAVDTEGFSPGSPVFFPPLKPTLPNSI